MRTNSPPPSNPGPTCLPRRAIVLNSVQHHTLMAALADYERLSNGSLLALIAREIGQKLAPEVAA